jgi:arylsulfatase A-like enzyme
MRTLPPLLNGPLLLTGPVLLLALGACKDEPPDWHSRKVPVARSYGSGTIAHVPPVPDTPTPVEKGPRHVVIVSIDTLRADYLGCYGSDWVQSPHIDRLCEQSVVFDHHISAAPTTLASHTSLLTGTWPHTHGVSRNGFAMSRRNVLLGEVLQDAGFVTAAFVAAFPLDPRFRMDQGFHLYEATFDVAFQRGVNQQAQRDGDQVTDAALAFAATRDAETERLFMFVHYFDVHAPYDADERWQALYPDPPGGQSTDGSLPEIKAARKDLEVWGSSSRSEPLRRAYAAGVSQADHEVGRLLEGLGPMLDDTLLIVTSDHGEAMDESTEYWNHGYGVHDVVIRTPLIVQAPGLKPRRTDVLVSNVDVVPTVLDELGLPWPDRVEGVSLSGTLRGDPAAVRSYAYAEATKPYSAEQEGQQWRNSRKCRAARTQTHKRQRCPHNETAAFYALPDETTDLSGEHAAEVSAYDAALDAWQQSRKPLYSRFDRNPSVEAMLKELGYLEEEGAGDPAATP